MTKIYWLRTEDPEWDTAWSQFSDPTLYNAEYHESLQYMGTVAVPGDGWTDLGGYAHQFRHRAMPGTNERRYWTFRCSPGWHPLEIAMQRHLERLGA